MTADLFEGEVLGDVTGYLTGNISGTSRGLRGVPSITINNLTTTGTITLPNNSLTDAMVSNLITASNYLPLSGGNLSGNLILKGSLLPYQTETYNLGSLSRQWQEVYATTFRGELTGDVTGNVSGNATGLSGNPSISITNLTATGTLTLPDNSLADSMIPNTITVSNYLPLSGGTLSGNLSLGTNNITNGGSITANLFTGDLTGNVTGDATGLFGAPSITISGLTMATGASNGYVLTTNGSGVASWTDISGTGGPWTLGGTSLYPDDTSYNVGIGTTNPQAELEIAGDLLFTYTVGVDRNISVAAGGNNQSGSSLIIAGGDAGAILAGSVSGGNVNINGGIGRAMMGDPDHGDVILADLRGNVGIGTTAPGAKLEVMGSSDATQVIIKANSSQSNTNPLVKLQNNAGDDLLHFHSDAPENIFIGYEVGINNTYSYDDWEGIDNIFIGYQAGYTNTIGADNVFMGYQTGYGNTTGIENVAIGYNALYSNTEGTSNVAIGSSALWSNTLGQSNIAIGGALANNTEGSGNIALGNSALEANSFGSNNIALGFASSWRNTTGEYNTTIGYYTLYNNQTGRDNISIGSNAGFWSTGSYNIYLGAGTVGVAAESNKLYINNEAGDSTPTTSLIYGDFNTNTLTFNANVGVGTTAPQSKLHVPDGSYAQFQDNNAGAPALADCDNDAERGRISIDTTNNRLYICNGATRGWDYVALTD